MPTAAITELSKPTAANLIEATEAFEAFIRTQRWGNKGSPALVHKALTHTAQALAAQEKSGLENIGFNSV
jgi:hypothetical protein